MNPISLHAEQDAIVRRAQAAANAVETLVGQVWAELLAIVRRKASFTEAFAASRKALAKLHDLPDLLTSDFLDVARYAQKQTHVKLARKLRERGAPVLEDTYLELAARHSVPIFKPPPLERTLRVIYASDWQERLKTLTKLASPDALAARIASGVQLGQTPSQIAQAILPLVQNVRSSAKRIARTEGVRIAHAEQEAAYEDAGDLIIGFEVRSMRIHSTRPWHAARHGKQYFKSPAVGQKGMHQCPHPPMEPDDPAERPAGTPFCASNCLCWLEPILRPRTS